MLTEENKALVRRYLQMYDTGDAQMADDILAAAFVDHSHPELPPGPEPVKRMVTDLRAAFPDAQTTVEDMICEGNTVAFRFTLRGTHTGPFAGIPATGKTLTLTGMDFIRVADGRIAELWSSQDTLSWALQLGIVGWTKPQSSSEVRSMISTRDQLIAELEQTHSTLVRLTASQPDEALDFRSAPGDWSVREILAHLVDDEMYVMRTRLERMMKEDRPNLAPHDEQKWYANRNTTRDQLTELLADFAVQRAASLGILTMLRESEWEREGYQPEYGTFTAEAWLSNWTAHDTTHIQQIANTLEAYAARPGEHAS